MATGAPGAAVSGPVQPMHDVRGVLRVRPFRRLLTAVAVSSFGDWLTLLALTALARQLAGGSYAAQSYAVAGVLLLRLLPALVLAPLAGVVADRLDRRMTMVVGDSLRCVLVLSIPLVGELWWVLAATFLIETVSLFWLPAKEASVPNLVPRERLEAANQVSLLVIYGSAPIAAALFSMLALVSRYLGDVIPYFTDNPVDLALFLDAVTFAVSGLLIVRIREIARQHDRGRSGAGVLSTIAEGWAFIGRSRVVRGLVGGIAGAFAAGGTVIGLGRVYVGDLGGADAAYGVLFGAVFLGLAGGMVLGPRSLRDLSRRRLFGLSIAVAGVVLALVGLASDLVLALLLVLVLGGAAGTAWVTGLTMLGLEVDDAHRGRTFAFVQALVRLVLSAVLAIGPAVAGTIGTHVIPLGPFRIEVRGAGVTIVVAGLAAVVVGIVALRQMDDRHGVPVRQDVWDALRHRAARVVPPSRVGPGLFIALEGGEGAGKSTQARLLAEWLRATGREVVLTHEPGDSRIGPAVRQILLDPESAGLSPRAEALLYAADRAEHVAAVVRPGLERGAVVVTDRFTDSSVAYQGSGRALSGRQVERISDWATEDLAPDLTVLLDVDPRVGLGRFEERDRLEAEPAAFHERVRSAFRELAARRPERYLVLDASRPAEEIAAAVRERVRALLGIVGDRARTVDPDGPPPAGAASGPGEPSQPVPVDRGNG